MRLCGQQSVEDEQTLFKAAAMPDWLRSCYSATRSTYCSLQLLVFLPGAKFID